MPSSHIGPAAARLEIYIDTSSLAALHELERFYTDRVKTRTASRSALIRRSLEALQMGVHALSRLPEDHPDLIGERLKFQQYRKARRS